MGKEGEEQWNKNNGPQEERMNHGKNTAGEKQDDREIKGRRKCVGTKVKLPIHYNVNTQGSPEGPAVST